MGECYNEDMSTSFTPSAESLQRAVAALQQGGIVAYPTEAVWGLGCNPFDEKAVRELLALKNRPDSKGLILIAADISQVEEWLGALSAEQRQAVEAVWPGPYTWIVPAPNAPAWLRGEHDGLAIRVSAHPVVQALCRAWGGPLVSTSANLSGEAPAADVVDLQKFFANGLSMIVEGALGGDQRPSEIRDAVTGVVLRAR